MPFDLRITVNAVKDLQEAIDWYNDQQKDLGKRFLNAFDKKIHSISITPGTGSIRYDNVRCTMLKVFPYVIHYTIDNINKQIIVLRVLHGFRKPIKV